MTTTLTDKQLLRAYWAAGKWQTNPPEAKGLRAVADLAITHLEAELHTQARELDRVRLALTEAQRK